MASHLCSSSVRLSEALARRVPADPACGIRSSRPRVSRSGSTTAVGSTRSPAATLQPDLRPGVRVRLPHDEVAADRIPLAAQVTGDDSRRNVCAAHERDECRSVMAAEAASGVEKKIVHRVVTQQRRRQRVHEAAGAEELEHRVDEFAIRADAWPASSRASCNERGFRPGGNWVSTSLANFDRGCVARVS